MVNVQVLMMSAIAVDRFTSLAQPLRYNNLITHASMERYILVFWIYSALAGCSPVLYSHCYSNRTPQRCAFLALVERPVQLFLFCTVYGPSALILLGIINNQNIYI